MPTKITSGCFLSAWGWVRFCRSYSPAICGLAGYPFLSFFFFLFSFSRILHKWAGGGLTLAWMVALAFVLRLAVGVGYLSCSACGWLSDDPDDRLVLSLPTPTAAMTRPGNWLSLKIPFSLLSTKPITQTSTAACWLSRRWHTVYSRRMRTAHCC